MAPSPELGGQPKAPDKSGEDSSTPSVNSSSSTTLPAAVTATSSTPAAAEASPSSVSNSSNPTTQPSSSGIKHTSGTSSSGSATTQQQDSSTYENMPENDLKALLEEAITYKRPKDREHKSAAFNELLDKTEMEDQEQNFPFTSRPVQSKRISSRATQGGSLQDLQEVGRSDYLYPDLSFAPDYYTNLSGLGFQTSRRHHGSSGGSSGTSVGPGGGDRSINPRQKQRYTSSVSSRQREGGSLPSNVNVECPFFNDVGHHHATGTITKIKKRDGSKSEYGTMLLTAPLTNAGAEEIISAVAEVAGNAGFCGGMKNTESQLIDGCDSGVGHTVIDMGEMEPDETQHLLAHDVLQQNLYESSLGELEGGPEDLYGSSTVGSGSGSTGGSGCSSIKKIPRYPPNVTTICTYPKMGDPPSPVRPTSVHHVDKTVSLPMLESNKDITSIQLGSNYPSLKSFNSNDTVKSDQMKHVMMGTISTNNPKFITTQSFNQIITQHKSLDENGNSVQQFNSGLASSSGGLGSGSGLGITSGSSSLSGNGLTGGKKKRKPLPASDRNTVLVIPENIAGYRGKEDIVSLVDFIENKDKQSNKDGKSGGTGGSNPKNGTLVKTGCETAVTAVENGIPEEKGTKKKGEKKKEKAKLKKSNSLEELSSNSKKKQQAEEEQDTQENPVEKQNGPSSKDMEAVVSLRSKTNKKTQQSSNLTSINSTACLSTTSSQSTKDSTSINVGKRSERRSWGTEELSYLEDTQSLVEVAASIVAEKAEEKPPKKDNKRDSKESPALIPFNLNKKRDSMSVESLSALSAGGSAETAEFHVVTKKKKTKKKSQSLFAEETTSAVIMGSSGNASNRRHLTTSQSYTLGGTSSSRNTHKYQTSNTFTNDRDVYMTSLTSSNDVSRRKSTSSVPPSEKSDSSDADSVQSLPIEPSRKQQQQHQSSQHHQQSSGQSSRGSSGVPQSYADIARIPNADKINNNLGTALSTSPLDSSSVDKWPPVQATTSEDLAQALKSSSAFPELVPDSSLSSQNQPQQQHQQYQQQHQYVNSSVNSVSSNIVGNSNKATYSQSLLIAATKAPEEASTMAGGKLVSNVNNEHIVNSSNSSSSSSNINISNSVSSKSTLLKSKSVDNNDIYYSNEHYPALEKTVKPSKATAPQTVVTGNSLPESKPPATVSKTNAAVPSASVQSLTSTMTNPASMTSTAATTNTASTTTNTTTNNSTGAKKSKKKDFVITSTSTASSEVESINNARNVAAVQNTLDTLNNNAVLIENADSSDYSQNNGLTNRSPNGGLNLQQHPQSTPKTSSSVSSSAGNPKRNKKEKSSSYNAVAAINSDQSSTQINFSSTATQNAINHRPAVIIMNDNNEPNPKHEFTFGFDIDQELLFGDFQEEEMSMLDHQSQQQYQFHQKQTQQPLHHSNSTENVPSPSSNTSTDLGYSSMQQSTASPSSSNNSSTSSQIHQQHQQHPHHHHQPQHHHQHHHQQQYHQQQHQTESFEMLNNSADPDTYRDSIEHKFHQPPPPMVLPPAPFYSQPPPQLPPPHILQQQQQSRQSRPLSHGNTAYTLPPPPVHPSHMQQQPPAVIPVMVTKQDNSTNTSPTGPIMGATSPPTTATIITVPPPPLPPVVPVAAIPVVPIVPLVVAKAQPTATATVVLVPAGPPPPVAPQAIIAQQPSLANTSIVVPLAIGNVSNINTSLNNQIPTTVASHNSNSSGCMSSSSSVSSSTSSNTSKQPATVAASTQQQPEPKPQRQSGGNNNSSSASVSANTTTMTTTTGQPLVPQAPLREKMKEINLRFIAPEQLQTNHNHDKIVNFVGMAWEDIICGTDAKYYNDGQ